MGKTLAIIGASYLQLPLVKRAKELGVRTICFAWEDGAVCKDVADVFYPISVMDKEAITEKCLIEKIDGITSVASDIVVPTIAYVANAMGLVGNSLGSAAKSTNKYLMRQALMAGGVSCPGYAVVSRDKDVRVAIGGLSYPMIVKPSDRSGSIGVMRVDDFDELIDAVRGAISYSFSKSAIIEECIVDMHEVSVEGISWKGEYNLLQMTDKVTTGAPHYVELGHHQPAKLSSKLRAKIENAVRKGVEALDVRFGASHAELMITPDERVYMTEIGARMGGDFIGSDLVRLSTGYDFLQGVIECALGAFSGISYGAHKACSGVWFYAPTTEWVKDVVEKRAGDRKIIKAVIQNAGTRELTKSMDRSGYLIYAGASRVESMTDFI